MRIIYRIAKAELNILFYSPIAWFVLIVFSFQSGLIFTDLLNHWVNDYQFYGNIDFKRWGGISHLIFSAGGGLYSQIQGILFFYIPILTMGLMSRETSTGSIKLLMSSPIRVYQIVLGKFLSMLVYCSIFVIIIIFYVIIGKFSIVSMDFWMAIVGLSGIYLTIAVYISIGLFVSSLTSYQLVAAVGTIAILAALGQIDQVGQNIAVLRTITPLISLSGKNLDFYDGLLISSCVIYLVGIVILFLFLTTFKLEDARSKKPYWLKIGKYLMASIFYLLVEFILSRPRLTFYYDSTSNKNETLSPVSQDIIRKIGGPIKITAFTNLLDDHAGFGLPENWNKDIKFWSPYIRFMPNMQLKYIFYYDTSNYYGFSLKENAGLSLKKFAEKRADVYGYNMNMFLSPIEMKKYIFLDAEEKRFVRKIESGSKYSILRTFDDHILMGQPREYEITNALAQLVTEPPKILFLTGEYERSIFNTDIKDYGYATTFRGQRDALINQGFIIDTISLTREIPSTNTILFIGDPKINFNESQLEKLERYILKGGNMVIAGEPGRQSILNPLLAKLGVKMNEGVLIQPNQGHSPDFVLTKFTNKINDYFNIDNLMAEGQNNILKVAFSGATGLSFKTDSSFNISPILVTDSGSTWEKMGLFSLDTLRANIRPDAFDKTGSSSVGLLWRRSMADKEQRIAIFGDADFMNNVLINEEGNSEFLIEMFKWLCYGTFPKDTAIKPQDIMFRININDVARIRILFLGIIPLLLLIRSVIVLVKRRRL